ASTMFWPCETRTSTCRSFATISSGLYRFLAIAVLLDVKDIPQVGPLQWGWITNNRFGLDDDGLYMNGKLCWPVEPVTCLRPDGTAERCESRQVPLPRPRPEDAPAPVPIPKTALYYEPGGIIRDQIERWQRIAQSDNDVEIRGECMSACTLIMAYVPN